MTNVMEVQQYWAGEPFSTLLSQIQKALEAKESLIVVEGAKGSGKSALAKALAHNLLQNQDAVIVIDHPPASNAELQRICREQQSALGEFAFMVALEKYLLQLSQNRKRCVLIIDNAEQLNAEVITGIRMMTNLQSATHRLLQVVMLGSNDLLKILSHPQSGGLSQRVSLHAQLPALNREQLKQMLFELYGVTLTDSALSSLDKLAKGRPEFAVKVGQQLAQQHGDAPIGRVQLSKTIGQSTELSKIRSKQRLSLLTPLAVIATAGAGIWLYLQQPPQVVKAPVSPSSETNTQSKQDNLPERSQQLTDKATKQQHAQSAQTKEQATQLQVAQTLVTEDPTEQDSDFQIEDAIERASQPVLAQPLTSITTKPVEQSQPKATLETPELPLEQLLSQTIVRWIDAWQRKDIGGYFDAYTPTFTPTNGASHQQWRDERTDRILAIEWMRMSMGELEVIEQLEPDRLILRVWLNYASPGYQDQTLKELNMVNIAGRWLIEEERNKVVKRGDLVLTPEAEVNPD